MLGLDQFENLIREDVEATRSWPKRDNQEW
jgi:hypothetical protein